MPNPSGAGGDGQRMIDYTIRASSAGGQAVQVVPGLLNARTPVTANMTTGGVGGTGHDY